MRTTSLPHRPARRRRALLAVLAVASVALASCGDDDATTAPTTEADDGGTTSTTQGTTTTEASTTTTAEGTTTTAPTTSTTAPTTSTSATPTTIDPARCVSSAADDPDPTAEVVYEAYTVGDRSCAGNLATADALDALFAIPGGGGGWSFEGCSEQASPAPHTLCSYRFEGGSTGFRMDYSETEGWTVYEVFQVAD